MPTPLVRDALLRRRLSRALGFGSPSYGYSGTAFKHFCAQRANRVLYMACITTVASTSSAPVSAVSVDGAAATKVTGTAYSFMSGYYSPCLSLWRYIAPALECEVSVTASFDTYVVALDFFNVHQTTPNGTAAVQNSLGPSRSVNVTGALNDLVIDLVQAYNPAPAADQIVITDRALLPVYGYAMSYRPAVAGTNTMSWTDEVANGGAMIGVAIKPA